jgi:hypothetical protein
MCGMDVPLKTKPVVAGAALQLDEMQVHILYPN